MTDRPLWALSAATLAAKIGAGEVSAAEAVEANIARMDEANPALNAVVQDLRDEARAEAAALDRTFAESGPVGPLHGVPVTIKVNVDQKGWATTNGVTALKDAVAPDDAPVVCNLKKAGAVVIGRTNTPEFSFRADTDNPLHGRTYNPWDRGRSAGGSSGGAGAAVMAGIGALGHGNDIGGSLRFPAAANGAATVKPGLGRVPAWNPSQAEERGMLAQHMSVQGVIARDIADVRLGMKAIIAPDPRDPWMTPAPFDGPAPDGPVRVAFTKEMHGRDLHPDVESALDEAAAALADAGYVVEAAEPPDLPGVADDGYRALMGEVKALMGPAIRAHGSDTVNGIFDVYFEMFPPLEGDDLLKAMARRSGHARAWSRFMERYPLILTPFLPKPFFRAGRDAEGWEGVAEVLGDAIWSYSMNFLGLPAGNVPAGLSDGLPVNIQIVGRRFREDLVLDACEAVERRAGVMFDRLLARGLDLRAG